MRWLSNDHLDVVTVSTSGSCRSVPEDQPGAPSVRAETTVERKKNDASEGDREEAVVPKVRRVQIRSLPHRKAVDDEDKVDGEVPPLDLLRLGSLRNTNSEGVLYEGGSCFRGRKVDLASFWEITVFHRV